MLGMLIYSIELMLVSPELVKILGAKSYWDSVYAVIPLITGGYFAFLYTLPAGIEYFFEKTSFIMIGTVCSAVVNIFLNFIFIPKYGYISAAYCTLVTYLLYFVFHYFLARKLIGNYIFSNKFILAAIVVILVANFIVVGTVNLIVIRWVCAIAIFMIALWLEEKNLGIIKKRILDRRL